jgi:hypothetical protein
MTDTPETAGARELTSAEQRTFMNALRASVTVIPEPVTLTLEAFRRFWFRTWETDEAKLRAWVAEHPEHSGDCTKKAHTCPVCLLALMEEEIATYWPMIEEECKR